MAEHLGVVAAVSLLVVDTAFHALVWLRLGRVFQRVRSNGDTLLSIATRDLPCARGPWVERYRSP